MELNWRNESRQFRSDALNRKEYILCKLGWHRGINRSLYKELFLCLGGFYVS